MEDSSVSDTNSDYQEADYGFYSEMRSDLSQRDSSKKLFQLKKVIEANPTNSTVLCVIEDHKAPVACRSFQSYHEDDTHEVQISIPGYRIVYEDGKHFAEYQSENDLKDSRLERIIGAWNAVVRHRPWFQISINIGYYVLEMSLLNKFLNTTLYELPHYELIVEFFC